MEYPRPKISIANNKYDLLSFDEFKEKKELYHMSNPSIGYNLQKGYLDFTKIGRFRYIIWNDKAIAFKLTERRPHKGAGLT